MRKIARWALAFAGSLLLVAPCVSTSYAFTGWVEQEDGTMVYLDKYGQRVTDTWMKRGNTKCYLDENGIVATNQFVEYNGDDCYVDETGALAKNKWVSTLNIDEECDQEVDILWYYFDKKGRMAKYDDSNPTKKWNINASPKAAGNYFFDSDGHMLSGWQDFTNSDGDIETYYLGEGDDGKMRTEWHLMEPREDTEPEDPGKSYDEKVWYYFTWEGIQIKDQEKKINGSHYQFDINGVMMTGWYPGVYPHDADFAVNKYYSKDTGARMEKCWVYACAQDDYEETEEKHWYYLGKKGEVFNEGGKDAGVYSDEGAQIAIKHIDNHDYGFDATGRMIIGLVDTRDGYSENDELTEDEFQDVKGSVVRSSSDVGEGIYYFEAKNEANLGQMQKGKVKLETIAGTVQFCFRDRGEAYVSCIVEGSVYDEDGRRLCGDGQTEVMSVNYDIYDKNADEEDAPLIYAGEEFIVSASGKIKKSGTIKIDGIKYKVERYVVTETEE